MSREGSAKPSVSDEDDDIYDGYPGDDDMEEPISLRMRRSGEGRDSSPVRRRPSAAADERRSARWETLFPRRRHLSHTHRDVMENGSRVLGRRYEASIRAGIELMSLPLSRRMHSYSPTAPPLPPEGPMRLAERDVHYILVTIPRYRVESEEMEDHTGTPVVASARLQLFRRDMGMAPIQRAPDDSDDKWDPESAAASLSYRLETPRPSRNGSAEDPLLAAYANSMLDNPDRNRPMLPVSRWGGRLIEELLGGADDESREYFNSNLAHAIGFRNGYDRFVSDLLGARYTTVATGREPPHIPVRLTRRGAAVGPSRTVMDVPRIHTFGVTPSGPQWPEGSLWGEEKGEVTDGMMNDIAHTVLGALAYSLNPFQLQMDRFIDGPEPSEENPVTVVPIGEEDGEGRVLFRVDFHGEPDHDFGSGPRESLDSWEVRIGDPRELREFHRIVNSPRGRRGIFSAADLTNSMVRSYRTGSRFTRAMGPHDEHELAEADSRHPLEVVWEPRDTSGDLVRFLAMSADHTSSAWRAWMSRMMDIAGQDPSNPGSYIEPDHRRLQEVGMRDIVSRLRDVRGQIVRATSLWRNARTTTPDTERMANLEAQQHASRELLRLLHVNGTPIHQVFRNMRARGSRLDIADPLMDDILKAARWASARGIVPGYPEKAPMGDPDESLTNYHEAMDAVDRRSRLRVFRLRRETTGQERGPTGLPLAGNMSRWLTDHLQRTDADASSEMGIVQVPVEEKEREEKSEEKEREEKHPEDTGGGGESKTPTYADLARSRFIVRVPVSALPGDASADLPHGMHAIYSDASPPGTYLMLQSAGAQRDMDERRTIFRMPDDIRMHLQVSQDGGRFHNPGSVRDAEEFFSGNPPPEDPDQIRYLSGMGMRSGGRRNALPGPISSLHGMQETDALRYLLDWARARLIFRRRMGITSRFDPSILRVVHK